MEGPVVSCSRDAVIPRRVGPYVGLAGLRCGNYRVPGARQADYGKPRGARSLQTLADSLTTRSRWLASVADMITRSPSHLSTKHAATAPPRGIRSVLAHRVAGLPAWVVLTQLFIGLGWLRAAAEKMIDPSWWRGEGIASFLAEHEEQTLGWYAPFVDLVVSPYAAVFAAIVVLAQIVAGTSLVTGRFVGAGLAVGMFLNLNFMAAGAVNPSAFYLLSQGAVALWMVERSRAGRRARQLLQVVAVAAATAGVLSLPFLSNLHPSGVIDDPAAMFVLGGALTVIGCDLAHRHLTGGDGLA